MKNIISFDVEDWYQASNLNEAALLNNRGEFSNRVSIGVDLIFKILAEHNTKATFFILGDTALANPELVKRINIFGHEIAAHGFRHTSLNSLSPQEFRQDIRKALEIITAITGLPVKGYRAPNYTVGKDTFWVLDILKEEGFKYDASIYPLRRFTRGGFPGFRRDPHYLPNG